jgi:hypothetical protein
MGAGLEAGWNNGNASELSSGRISQALERLAGYDTQGAARASALKLCVCFPVILRSRISGRT